MKKKLGILFLVLLLMTACFSNKEEKPEEVVAEGITVNLTVTNLDLKVDVVGNVVAKGMEITSVIVDWGEASSQNEILLNDFSNINISHTYAEGGDYGIEITVFDKEGSSETKDFNITVLEATEAEYITEIDTKDVAYNYNEDGTAAFALNSKQIDKLLEFEIDQTNDTVKEDLKYKVANLIDEKFVVENGYFPKGKAGNYLVEVKDGTVDISNYELPGDVNSDGSVNELDLEELEEAIVNKSIDLKYDINKNGKVDIKDLAFSTSRLMTDSTSFSFFTEDGVKLDVLEVLYSERGVIKNSKFNDYTKLRVVVNDLNGDNQLIIKEEVVGVNRIKKDAVISGWLKEFEKAFEAKARKIDKYIVSFEFKMESIDMITRNGKLVETKDVKEQYIGALDNIIESKVKDVYFKYDMGISKRFVSKLKYIAHFGDHSSVNTAVNPEVKAEKVTGTKVIINGSGSKMYKSIINYSYIYYTEPAETEIKGEVSIGGWDKVNGKLKFTRLGPGDDRHYLIKEFDVEDGKYEGKELSSGNYRVDFFVPGEKVEVLYTIFEENRDKSLVFIGRKGYPQTYNMSIKQNKIKIKGKIKNGEDPVVDQEVVLVATVDGLKEPETEPVVTNEEGEYVTEGYFIVYDVKIGEKGSKTEDKKKKQKVVAIDEKSDGNLDRYVGKGKGEISTETEESDDYQDALDFFNDGTNTGDEESSDFPTDNNEQGDEVETEGWFDGIEDSIFKSLFNWLPNWNTNEIEVPDIKLNTYDIILEIEEEVVKASVEWTEVEIDMESKKTSEWMNSGILDKAFLKILSNEEDIAPNSIDIEIVDDKTAETFKVRALEENTDSFLSVYQINKNLTLPVEDPYNLGLPDEYHYTEGLVYIDIQIGWELYAKGTDLYPDPDEYAFQEMMGNIDEDGNWAMPQPGFNITLMPDSLKTEYISGNIIMEDLDGLLDDEEPKNIMIEKEFEDGEKKYKLVIKPHVEN